MTDKKALVTGGVIDRVLFVMAKHERCKPEWGPTAYAILPETFKETGFAREITLFYLDELTQQLGQSAMDEALLKICAADKPDLIIFLPAGWPHIDPSRNTMNTITSTLGIKVYMVRDDASGVYGHLFNQSWFPFVSFIGFTAMSVSSLGYSNNPKALQAFCCPDTKHFYDKKLERDIDVSFVGSIGNWQRRAEYIQFLWEHGISIATGGGLEYETKIPIEEYSDIISRSKISLSFCLHRTEGYSQIKGRVFNIMLCKTCVLEDEGIETKEFFEEGKDFVMYHSKEEMLEKVNYYLKHDEERERIAESGYRKATELYSAKNLWAYTLEKTGFTLPDDVVGDKNYRELSRKLDLIRGGL